MQDILDFMAAFSLIAILNYLKLFRFEGSYLEMCINLNYYISLAYHIIIIYICMNMYCSLA